MKIIKLNFEKEISSMFHPVKEHLKYNSYSSSNSRGVEKAHQRQQSND